MDEREFLKTVLAGAAGTALGTPLGDVLKELLWIFIARGREWVVLQRGHVGAPLNATPGIRTSESNANGVQTSESNANGDARADGPMAILDVKDHIDPQSDEIADVANGGVPS